MDTNANSTIFEPVKHAIMGMFSGFAAGKVKEEPVHADRAEQFIFRLITLYNQVDDFLSKVRQQDELFETYTEFTDLQEYCFDLLMINFFATDSRYLEEDFMESAEWLKIEEETLDRGTELLNIFLYAYEAKEAEVDISIEDFLNEFLLADDELYQDEYFIYEPVIVHQELVESSIDDILEVYKGITNDEIKDVFIPLILFFNEDTDLAKVSKSINKKVPNSALTLALLYALNAFSNGVDSLPNSLAKLN